VVGHVCLLTGPRCRTRRAAWRLACPAPGPGAGATMPRGHALSNQLPSCNASMVRGSVDTVSPDPAAGEARRRAGEDRLCTARNTPGGTCPCRKGY
jgi:hypothetical protein